MSNSILKNMWDILDMCHSIYNNIIIITHFIGDLEIAKLVLLLYKDNIFDCVMNSNPTKKG